MTACNVAVSKDGSCAWILTDSLSVRSYDDDTVADDQQDKAWVGKGFVFAARGRVGNIRLAIRRMKRYTSFDDAFDRFSVDLARGLRVDSKRILAKYGWRKAKLDDVLEVFLVGYSARRGRIVAAIAHTESAVPFQPHEGLTFFAPETTGYDVHGATARSKAAFASGIGVPDALLGIMQMQRANYFEDLDEPDLPRREVIGGSAQLTTVTRDSVEKSIIHRWPQDKVGHRISP